MNAPFRLDLWAFVKSGGLPFLFDFGRRGILSSLRPPNARANHPLHPPGCRLSFIFLTDVSMPKEPDPGPPTPFFFPPKVCPFSCFLPLGRPHFCLFQARGRCSLSCHFFSSPFTPLSSFVGGARFLLFLLISSRIFPPPSFIFCNPSFFLHFFFSLFRSILCELLRVTSLEGPLHTHHPLS